MATWEIEFEKLDSSKPCACGLGTIDTYELIWGHTKVMRSKTTYETSIVCSNPECPSKK